MPKAEIHNTYNAEDLRLLADKLTSLATTTRKVDWAEAQADIMAGARAIRVLTDKLPEGATVLIWEGE